MLLTEQRETLHEVARKSIEHGLSHGQPLPVEPSDYDGALQAMRATFVTLEIKGQLRGCIGVLEPIRTLVEDVANNAYSAAFSDTRFAPLQADELSQISIHISILNPAQEIEFNSEQDLISQLRPGVDGLILREQDRKATFLPSVWDKIDTATEFLQHLKHKAGLPTDYWSDSIQAYRYSVDDV